jgi:predicted dithiol-disulfide oxidoreductase (DUF899 family)
VASLRRALPEAEIPQDFWLTSETRPLHFPMLFGGKQALMIYSTMYGPQRETPCPMCMSFLNSRNGTSIGRRTARSSAPARLSAAKLKRIFSFTAAKNKFRSLFPCPSATYKIRLRRNARIGKNACYFLNRKNLVAPIGVRGH